MKKILIASALILGFAGSASAITVVNGGFETGDFTGWATASSGGGSTAVVMSSSAYPAPNGSGTLYTPIEGNYMAEITSTAWIWEGQSWEAGETFGFNWAFLGYDYMPFNDAAMFQVDDQSAGNNDLSFTLADIAGVGDYQDTGWQTFSYTFLTAGTGTFTFKAANSLDSILDSKLLIDAVGNPVPEPTAMLIFGAGLAGLAGFTRRKKK